MGANRPSASRVGDERDELSAEVGAPFGVDAVAAHHAVHTVGIQEAPVKELLGDLIVELSLLCQFWILRRAIPRLKTPKRRLLPCYCQEP
jgi:hypothetical protein